MTMKIFFFLLRIWVTGVMDQLCHNNAKIRDLGVFVFVFDFKKRKEIEISPHEIDKYA